MKNKIRIISLNIWNGKLEKKLLAFINKYSKKVDIFCFQESLNSNNVNKQSLVTNGKVPDIHSKIQKILPEFNGYFEAAQDNDKGLSIFIRKKIQFDKVINQFVYRWKNSMILNDRSTIGRNILCLTFKANGRVYNVINFHGLWNGFSKEDSEDRINQSENILDFIKKLDGEIILCGDFNLLPKTQSLKMIEGKMRNLMLENNIKSTRNKYFPGGRECIDYIFVTPNIKIHSFSILKDIVSDHLAIYFDFSLGH